MSRIHPHRRGMIVGGLGTALVGAGAAVSLPTLARKPDLDLADPANRLRAYMLMRGALDERLVIGFAVGRYYGVQGDVARPLFGVVSCTFARFRSDGEGGYVGASYEVPYFTDLDGRIMDRWMNPYTDEEVEAPHRAFPPARIAIAPDLRLTLPNGPAGMAFDHHVLPPATSADDVWMTEETFTALTVAGLPDPVRFSEVLTLHALKSDLENPEAKRVPCQVGYNATVSWRPWMKMGDRPGHMNAVGHGAYGAALGDLPPALLKVIGERQPTILADPAAPLAPLFDA